MNPYLEIARAHLTVEELEMLLAEKKKPTPKLMTKEQEFELELQRRFEKIF